MTKGNWDMMIAKNDEEKRSKIWRLVTLIATIVIMIVAGYFLFTLFAGNPLEGTWASKESNMNLTIRKGGAATVFWPEMGETSNVKLNINYTITKDRKTISFKIQQKEIEKTVKDSDGKLTEDAISAAVGALDNTFDYSLSGGKLTLAEREYGNQMIFVKK